MLTFSSPAAKRIWADGEAYQRSVARKADSGFKARAAAVQRVLDEGAPEDQETASAAVGAAQGSCKAIIREVAAKWDMSPTVITGRSRRRLYTEPRQEATYRCVTETGLSYTQIGQQFGDRDHTSVLHNARAHAKRHGLPEPGRLK